MSSRRSRAEPAEAPAIEPPPDGDSLRREQKLARLQRTLQPGARSNRSAAAPAADEALPMGGG
eukprot:3637191-Prymnesium_polylepis.1